MRLDNQFTVPVGVEDAWKVLLDVERVAPCLPGASLDSVDGDHFTGRVKVKLGPIGMTYRGNAKFASLDHAHHTAVIEASGKDTRGASTASATVTASLVEEAGGTKVDVQTELNITGRPAQFGRGVLADVSAKLVDQFADCLASRLAFGELAPAAATATTTTAAEAQPAGAPEAATSGAAAPESLSPAAEDVAASEAAAPEAGGPGGEAAAGGQGEGGNGAESPQGPASVTAGAAAAPAAVEGNGAAAAGATAPAAGAATSGGTFEPEPLDLLDAAGVPVLKRIGPLVAAVLAVAVVLLLWRRSARRRSAAE